MTDTVADLAETTVLLLCRGYAPADAAAAAFAYHLRRPVLQPHERMFRRAAKQRRLRERERNTDV